MFKDTYVAVTYTNPAGLHGRYFRGYELHGNTVVWYSLDKREDEHGGALGRENRERLQ